MKLCISDIHFLQTYRRWCCITTKNELYVGKTCTILFGFHSYGDMNFLYYKTIFVLDLYHVCL